MVYYQNFYGIELSTYKALDRFYMFFITIMALFGELYLNILILSVSPNSIHSIHCDQFAIETTETQIYTIDLLSEQYHNLRPV